MRKYYERLAADDIKLANGTHFICNSCEKVKSKESLSKNKNNKELCTSCAGRFAEHERFMKNVFKSGV